MVSHQRRSSSSSPAKATCFIVMSSGVLGLIIFNRGIIPIAYTGIAGGAPAPFVVPSDDEIQLLQVQIGVMTHCINSHALVGINTWYCGGSEDHSVCIRQEHSIGRLFIKDHDF